MNTKRQIGTVLIYMAFYALIGFALWVSDSLWVLLALAFTPEEIRDD